MFGATTGSDTNFRAGNKGGCILSIPSYDEDDSGSRISEKIHNHSKDEREHSRTATDTGSSQLATLCFPCSHLTRSRPVSAAGPNPAVNFVDGGNEWFEPIRLWAWTYRLIPDLFVALGHDNVRFRAKESSSWCLELPP